MLVLLMLLLLAAKLRKLDTIVLEEVLEIMVVTVCGLGCSVTNYNL